MNREAEKEFSRRIAIADLPEGESVFEIGAEADERSALASRLGVTSIDRLDATIMLSSLQAGRRVEVEGRVTAEITQACVVTLAPVRHRIEARFERVFSADSGPRAEGETVSWKEDDWIEPFENGSIDIGRATVEQLALEIDPYPRAPGARFEGFSSESKEIGGAAGPFAALAKLKPKR